MELKVDQKNNGLKRAIVEAIAFFDMFDFPLTDFEVLRFVGVECNLLDVRIILTAGEETKFPIGNLVSEKDGFYFLRGREGIADIRLKRHIFTGRKFKRARLVAKIFRFIPWIKMIAVANIIGERNLKDESDIDLFIITENKKIWLTRFFCAGLAKILGLRPKKGNERDKICLNFYVSEGALDVSGLMLNGDCGEVEPLRFSSENRRGSTSFSGDIYFRYWIVNLVPIYETDEAYKKFIQANDWIKNCFPNWRMEENNGRVLKNKPSRFNLFDLFFRKLENKFKKLELRLMPSEMKEMMNKDTRVVVNDKVLKLHLKDRREEYKKRWEEKIKNLEL